MKKILIIFLLCTTFHYSQFDYWEIYDTMPKPVAGGDIWQNNENIFIIGGYSDSTQNYTNWIQRYKLISNKWNLDTIKTARFGLVVENYNNQIYFFGGVNSDDISITGISNWGADINSEMALNYNNNFNRIFSTGHIIGDNFYIIGGNPLPGTRSDTLAYIVEYNLTESKIIHEIDTLFTDVDFPEQQMSEVIGDNIFIFGGEINGISQDIYKYNIFDHSYIKLDIKLLEPRAGGRAIIGSEPNQILIIGGYNENSQALNKVEVFYDFGNEYYITQAAPIQQARYNFMTAKLDDYIYIFGGFDENGKVINSIERTNSKAVTDLEESIIVNDFNLFQNYPNPFNPTTTIEYSIPSNLAYRQAGVKSEISNVASDFSLSAVTLIIYDILGREVATLVNKIQTPGNYKIQFDGTNLPSGIYYYQLRFGSNILTKKMLLLK